MLFRRSSWLASISAVCCFRRSARFFGSDIGNQQSAYGFGPTSSVRFPPKEDIRFAHSAPGFASTSGSQELLLPLAGPPVLDQMTSMNLDDQFHRYFGTSDLAAVPPEALDAGIEHMQVDLGLTRDRGERFALWALLQTLGSAPDLDVVFETDADREAARNFMDLIQGASGA